MKKIIDVFITVALVFISFSSVADEAVDIEKFARAFIDAEVAAWERGEFEALEALEAPDVVFQNIDGTVINGWQAHKKAIVDARLGFQGSDITQEWKYLMGEGNMFAVSYVWIIDYAYQPLKTEGIAIGRVEDGRLKEEWGASNTTPMIE